MKISIKSKKRILIYIIFCLIFSLSNEIIDFTKNKKILKYEIKLNARDFEKYAFKIKEDPFKLIIKNLQNFNFFGPYYYNYNDTENIYFFDQVFYFFHPHSHSEENVQALLRNYIKSNMKYNFEEFLDKRNFGNNQKNIMLKDFNKNLKLSFSIEKKSGIMTNEIVIKTFESRVFEEFFLSFIKDIEEHMSISWHINANKIVFENLKFKFMRHLSYNLNLLADKNILLNLNMDDTYKNLNNLNFFESNELIKICEFLDNNHYEIKSPKKFLKELEEIKKIQNHELFKLHEHNFIKFIKISENKFIDFYNVWSLLIISIFLILTAEILYRKIIK